jgi:hypothetical protein
MSTPESRNRNEKPKDQKKDAVSLLLTGLTIMGAAGTVKGAVDTYQNIESLNNANASLTKNHEDVKNYKLSHAQENAAATKAMLQRASDAMKAGNRNFSENAPEAIPSSYGESEKVIIQQQGEAKFGIAKGAINTIASTGIAAAMNTLKKLRDNKKNKKNKKD